MPYDIQKAYDAYWAQRDRMEQDGGPYNDEDRLDHVKQGIKAAIESALEDEGVRTIADGTLRIREDANVPEGMYVINGRLYRPVTVVVGDEMERLLGLEWAVTTMRRVVSNGGYVWQVEVEVADPEIDPEYGRDDWRQGMGEHRDLIVAAAMAVDRAEGSR